MDSYRHEYKFLVPNIYACVLQERIKNLIPLDNNATDFGGYNIRSLYFDNYADRCYYENENGVDPREKYRIRIYNSQDDYIKLECKKKENGKTHKRSCKLTKEQVGLFIKNDINNIVPDSNQQLLHELLIMCQVELMVPKVIVDYYRIPYTYQLGNVRITFDQHLGSSFSFSEFFSNGLNVRPVFPMGFQLLEVKFDEYLPDFIHQALQMEELTQTNFSKYYLCRKYHF